MSFSRLLVLRLYFSSFLSLSLSLSSSPYLAFFCTDMFSSAWCSLQHERRLALGRDVATPSVLHLTSTTVFFASVTRKSRFNLFDYLLLYIFFYILCVSLLALTLMD